uniref:Uncharacterized protein n=1 Tax=Physcomitrium patens TaxID=3218 RepID=A0A2K1KGI7_PHYPA|nr:hypothetical protein PHYPA_009269 [Physcomitrium patens]
MDCRTSSDERCPAHWQLRGGAVSLIVVGHLAVSALIEVFQLVASQIFLYCTAMALSVLLDTIS